MLFNKNATQLQGCAYELFWNTGIKYCELFECDTFILLYNMAW